MQKVREFFTNLKKPSGQLWCTCHGASRDTSNSKNSTAPIPYTIRYIPNIRINTYNTGYMDSSSTLLPLLNHLYECGEGRRQHNCRRVGWGRLRGEIGPGRTPRRHIFDQRYPLRNSPYRVSAEVRTSAEAFFHDFKWFLVICTEFAEVTISSRKYI